MYRGSRTRGIRRTKTWLRWTPSGLFAAGEEGAWYDPSDISTLFQDSAGTTPVTASGQPVGRISDKSGRGHHLVQATDALRPAYVLASNRASVQFNGVDQFLSCAFAPSAYPLWIWAGVKALADVDSGVLSVNQTDTQYKSLSKSVTADTWVAQDRNASILDSVESGAIASAHVLTAQFDLASFDLAVDTSNATAATANTNAFGAPTTLFMGKKRPAGLFFNGHVYGSVVRCATTAAPLSQQVRDYLNQSAGAF